MNRKNIFFGLIIAVVLAFFISPFASPKPDGLERVAEDKGFIDKGRAVLASPVADYLWPGVKSERLATSLAGIFGTLLVFAFGYGAAALLKKKNR